MSDGSLWKIIEKEQMSVVKRTVMITMKSRFPSIVKEKELPKVPLKGYSSDVMVAWDEPLYRAARFYFARVEESVTAHSNLATPAATWKSAKASTSDGTKPPTSQKYANTFNSVDTFDRRLAELAEYLPRTLQKTWTNRFENSVISYTLVSLTFILGLKKGHTFLIQREFHSSIFSLL